MRGFTLTGYSLVVVLCFSCAFPGSPSRFEVHFPSLPASWQGAFGECDWRLLWISPEGEVRRQDSVHTGVVIEVSSEGASAVIAYPCWETSGITCGMARPAGAIYPFQGNQETIELDWLGGVAAHFFRELSSAGGAERTSPERFDWPRFVDLLRSDIVPLSVREDPWSVDWRDVAVRTRQSGFDRRRIVSRSSESVIVEIPDDGPWAAASPFIPAPGWRKGEAVELSASSEVDTYFCSAGFFRYATGLFVWFPIASP